MTALRAALLAAYAAEDPDRQGIHWPDPIDHDGRPLAAQASDLLATAIADGPLDAALADLQAALVPPERQASDPAGILSRNSSRRRDLKK